MQATGTAATGPGLDRVLYNCLFADDQRFFENMKDLEALSWIYAGEQASLERIRRICTDEGIESRVKFLAAHTALQQGIALEEKLYFGSILEVPMGGGYDILAFYADSRARYYNHAGSAIIYEGGIADVDAAIAKTNEVSKAICQVIGPWEGPRLEPPTGTLARFTYLNSDGLYFGQGPVAEMSKDRMGSVILGSGAELMSTLIAHARK